MGLIYKKLVETSIPVPVIYGLMPTGCFERPRRERSWRVYLSPLSVQVASPVDIGASCLLSPN